MKSLELRCGRWQSTRLFFLFCELAVCKTLAGSSASTSLNSLAASRARFLPCRFSFDAQSLHTLAEPAMMLARASLRPLRSLHSAAQLEDTAAQRLKRHGVAGVQAAVIDGGQVTPVCAGLADVASGTPVASTTLFQLASLSKPVAARRALTSESRACSNAESRPSSTTRCAAAAAAVSSCRCELSSQRLDSLRDWSSLRTDAGREPCGHVR